MCIVDGEGKNSSDEFVVLRAAQKSSLIRAHSRVTAIIEEVFICITIIMLFSCLVLYMGFPFADITGEEEITLHALYFDSTGHGR